MLWERQEAFEKCWAHSPQRAASRQLMSLAVLSHAACASMSTTTTTTTTRDRGDRYGPMEWAPKPSNQILMKKFNTANISLTKKL